MVCVTFTSHLNTRERKHSTAFRTKAVFTGLSFAPLVHVFVYWLPVQSKFIFLQSFNVVSGILTIRTLVACTCGTTLAVMVVSGVYGVQCVRVLLRW